MKKIYFYFALTLLFLGSKDALAFTIGQMHKMSALGSVDKSIMVKNSSLDANADIVNWTETGVNSQRWLIIASEDGKFQFVNAYTDYILYRRGGASSGAKIVQYDKNDLSAGRWDITPVDGQEGYFYITQSEPKLYLESVSTDQGSLLELHVKKEGVAGNNQKWKLEEVEAEPNYLTWETSELMMQNWKDWYYKSAPVGKVLGNGGWWGDAEMFEVVLDAYETTGKQVHAQMFKDLYSNFVYRNGGNWIYNDFNDDIAWMVIASARAYLMFGDQDYLTKAKTNFDGMYARALLPSGMLRWKEEVGLQNGTNSCINGPSEVAACYLAIATGDESYYVKAKNLYALQRQYLYNAASGQVYDSFTWINGVPSNYNYWSSTYNQGTFLGAAVMLYNHFGDVQYKEDAKKIMDYTFKNLCDEHGVVKVCQVATGDLSGFKGILMRYIRRFVVDLGQAEYVEMMQRNALHAFNNRNSSGVSSSAWLTKAPENFIFEDCTNDCSFANDPFGPSTAVSAAFNAPLNKSLIFKDGFSKIEAEDFDYLKGVSVDLSLDGASSDLTNVKTGCYTAYKNVVFGNNLATRIKVRVSKALTRGTNIEVRLDSPDGRVVGTIAVPRDGDDWQTVSAEIEPMDGTHNIYLTYVGLDNVDLMRINYFMFEAENLLYPDITDNGGKLSTSQHQSPETLDGGQSLIDNRLSTKINVDIKNNPNSSWILYQSETPVTLKGYALGSGNDASDKDPKSWKLQASNNGTDWTDLDIQSNQIYGARYQINKYDLPTISDPFTHFRLFFTETNGNLEELHLSEFQLYGGGIFVNDITADGGLLTAQYVGNESEETFVTLIDKNIGSKYLVFDKSDLWLEYKANGIYTLASYSITSANDSPDRDPKNWTVYGSKDGNNWTEIDQQNNQEFLYREITQTYRCDNVNAYQYFKVHITGNNGASLTQIAEIQLHGNYAYDRFYNDITSNGGEVSSSYDGQINSVNNKRITDNNGDTYVVLDASGSSPWVQYKSTMPVLLRAYSITVAKNDKKFPRSWILQGSNDGDNWTTVNSKSNISFSMGGEQKLYPVTTNIEYNYFRLTISRISDLGATEVEMAELELHGTGFSQTDFTANGGAVSAEFPGLANYEGEDKLIDKLSSTKYCGDFSGSSWFMYQSTTPISITAYSVTSANDDGTRDLKEWILEASNNGINWTEIDSRNDQLFAYRLTTQYYGCNKDENTYTHFRLKVTGNNGSDLLQWSQWQLLNILGAGDISSAVHEVEDALVMQIYPNPVRDFLHIDLQKQANVYIYNVSGQLIRTMIAYQGVNTIDFSSYEKGAYIVRISSDKKVVTKKIMKY